MPAHAQEGATDLTAENLELIDGEGVYGQPIQVLHGVLVNTSADTAYTNITLSAAAYDADDALIGEGNGVIVNACGAGLVFDFALQPSHAHAFEISLDVFEQGVEIERIDVQPLAQAADAQPAPAQVQGIQQVIADQEVIAVEWIDNTTLRFGAGCSRDLFTTWDWYQYRVTQSGSLLPRRVDHPYAALVTDALMSALLFSDPELFNRSALAFAPDGDRLIYQDSINTVLTAGFQGQARRTLYSLMSRRSLQGIYWQPDERLIAYYFGAYGDPVYYFTATAEGNPISPALDNNPPSVTIPGVSRDGRRVVIGQTRDDITGYYLYVVTNNFFELLFEAELPGNNYPAPILISDPNDGLITHVYTALDVDGVPHLTCYNRAEGELYTLAPLPLRLDRDERAQWWASPDESKIALASQGTNGGLWLLDLTTLPACESE